uniref:Beta-lactamase n=1 Tax=Chitinophaga pinensis (strain ATCC 43595 / DSM 2588 / LMG 13176 / NBRC 15968 / NCIMB 11800 / UQM 2034) TaxID=485918 RepID=UPI0012F4779E
SNASAQDNNTRQKVNEIAATARGHVGVAMMSLENGDTMTLNGNDHFPMQSVFKVPLAIAVLDQVDKGKLSLDQVIHITKKELLPFTWSPIREKYPEGTDLKLREVLAYTVSQSDNNGCDILFNLVGGTAYVEQYIHGLGVDSMAIKANEERMASAWKVQYTNWSSPLATLQLLKGIHTGKYLSKASNDFLLKIMKETTTGPKRLRGMLPADAVVAHKTGSSDTKDGLTAATNDAGIVTLPDGSHLAIVVFVSDTKVNEAIREGVIARITRLFWDAAN